MKITQGIPKKCQEEFFFKIQSQLLKFWNLEPDYIHWRQVTCTLGVNTIQLFKNKKLVKTTQRFPKSVAWMAQDNFAFNNTLWIFMLNLLFNVFNGHYHNSNTSRQIPGLALNVHCRARHATCLYYNICNPRKHIFCSQTLRTVRLFDVLEI